MDRRRALALAALSSLALSPAFPLVPPTRPAAPAPDAKFTAAILPTGTKLDVYSSAVRNQLVAKPRKDEFEVTVNGTETATAQFDATVMQAEKSVDRMRIEFRDCPLVFSARVKNAPREMAVAHRTFEMFRKDGKNVFTGADGKEIPEADRLAVQPHFLPLVFELPLAHLLAGKTVKRGERIEVPLGAAAAALAPFRTVQPGATLALTLTNELVVDKQDCAIFAVAATLPLLGDAAAGSSVVLAVTGEFTVTTRHCLILLAKCEGSLQLPDAKGDGAGAGRKAPARDETPTLKGAVAKESWNYYVKFE